MAARSKSRKKSKAAKGSRARRASAKVVETPSPPLPVAALVEVIELPPDPRLQPVAVEVIEPPEPPLHPATVTAHEATPASAPQAPDASVVESPPERPLTQEPLLLSEPPPQPAAEDLPPKPIKILLVEDGNFLRLEIQRALVRAGYAVVIAVDGEAGIEAARNSHPDLILLDLLLPKIGGQDVLKILKKDPATADISVVVLTGLSQRNAERLQADGALAFLEKSDLALEKGPEVLLAALSAIVQQLPRTQGRKGAAAGSFRG